MTYSPAPRLLVPAAQAALPQVGTRTWPVANRAYVTRFTLMSSRSYRYLRFRENAQSGNIQVGVLLLSGTSFDSYTRVMDSGVIAAPATGDKRLDLGSTILTPGEYGLFMWADNTTVTLPLSSGSANYTSIGVTNFIDSISSGVPASGSLNSASWNIDSYLFAALEAG